MKEEFEQLLRMGYSVKESLAFLNADVKPVAEQSKPEPKTEPLPEPKTEPKPAEAPAEDPAKKETEFVTSETFLASQKATLDAIEKLTKAVQMNNIRTMGTDDDPTVNRADEFIANIIKGGK